MDSVDLDVGVCVAALERAHLPDALERTQPGSTGIYRSKA
jgi:hypothetical protein